MASNVAGPSNLFSSPVVGGMTTMFNHSSGNTSNTSNSTETSVYPPQPYALQQSTQQPTSGSAHTSPSTSASKTNKSDSTTDNTSTGSTVSGLSSRKRNASSSPGNDAKEKKARGEAGDDTTSSGSPGQKGPKNAASGSPTDVRAWGEEAAKLDVYVWDYLTRRGFPRAAKSLMNEAGMTEAPDVPLKTPQGLLFEYWAIFWDVFAARTGRGSTEATTYHEYQESRQVQKLNEVARRLEATDNGYHVPESQASRFPPVIMGGGSQVDAVNSATGGGVAAANMMSQMQARNGNGGAMNGTVQQQSQQAQAQAQQAQQMMMMKQQQQQQTGQPPLQGTPQMPGQGWNQAANPLQQQTQMLLLAAQRQNIPIDELKNMNPAMRNALIQSVTMGGPVAGGIRPPGPIPGAAGGNPAIDQNMQHRIQQQQALHRQMQRNVTQGGQVGPGRPQGPMQAQQISSPAPGTPGINGPADGRRSVGPGQQGPSGQPTVGPQGTPLQQGQMIQQQQQQQHPGTPGGMQANNMVRPGGPPMHGPGGEQQKHPTLTTEQQQMLMAQHQNLQHTLRNELHQAQVAPTSAIAERAFQTAQQIQLRLAQLGALLKAQPAFQQQAAAAQAQQQQQQAAMGVRPGMPPGSQVGMPGQPPMNFPPGMTPQQQQHLLAQRAQMAQQQRMGGGPGMGGNDGSMMMGAGLQPGMVNGRPLQQPGAGFNQFDAQQQQQHQQQQQQHGGANDYGSSEAQQRSHFAFANPFAAGGGGRRPSNSMPEDANGQQQQHPSHAPGYPQQQQQQQGSAQQFSGPAQGGPQRPPLPVRMQSGMGPPGNQHVSSPSPRIPQGNLSSQQDGSVGGSPANPPVPNTPKAAAAEKKKKETRSRKNSKAANANKTPVMTAASMNNNNNNAMAANAAATAHTPVAQAQTPVSTSMPTPGGEVVQNGTKAGNDVTVSASTPGPNRVAEVPAPPPSSMFDSSSFTANGDSSIQPPSSSLGNGAGVNDDSNQMFSNGDMSQFFNDFEFSTGNGFGSNDGSGLGSFGDAWDNSSLGNLFGDNMS